MKNYLKRRFWFILAVTAMVICAVFCLTVSFRLFEKNTDIADLFSVSIRSGNNTQSLKAWSADKENYYVFLPSYTELDSVSLAPSGSVKFSFNGREILEDTAPGGIEPEVAYNISLSNKAFEKSATLTFLKSANVAAVYIDTVSGNTEYIDKDKLNTENAGISVVNKDGKTEYSGDFTDEINSRGNLTFGLEKKSYILSLSDPASLLGMGASDKWILLANGFDESNLRNKLVLDFAKKSSPYWSPSGEYAELYLNGRYNGLYLVCEKIGIAENKLDLGKDSFIFEINLKNHMTKKDIFFVTDAGRAVRLNDSGKINLSRKNCLSIIQRTEDAVLGKSDFSEGENQYEFIDLDSFAERYFIDEFFMNNDGDLNSSYYYFNSATNKVYAGPVWDYDLCLGSIVGTMTIDVNFPGHITARDHRPYYSALYNDKTFFDRVTELYRQKYLPLISSYLLPDLKEQAEKIEQASELNSLRWRELFDKNLDSAGRSTEYLTRFINNRTKFLKTEWIEGVTSCSVWVYDYPQGYRVFKAHYYVTQGDLISTLPTPRELGLSSSDVWYLNGTDETLAPDTSIEDQIDLSPIPASSPVIVERSSWKERPMVTIKRMLYENCEIFATIFFLALSLSAMILAEVRKRKRGR